MTQTIAQLADDTLTITSGEFAATITVKQIAATWDARSHFPESRARLELAVLEERLNNFARRLEELEAPAGALNAAQETEAYTRGHVELTRRAWALENRCMFWFIVGPAKFPTARNEKSMASRDKGYRLMSEHPRLAIAAVRRRAFPYGAPSEAVRANNPDAPQLPRAKIDRHQRRHALMKAANMAIRASRAQDETVHAEAVQGATGLPAAICSQLVRQDEMGRRGFADYQLAGALAEITRLAKRLADIETVRAKGTRERSVSTELGEIHIVENADAARIQLLFPGKPDAMVRAHLK